MNRQGRASQRGFDPITGVPVYVGAARLLPFCSPAAIKDDGVEKCLGVVDAVRHESSRAASIWLDSSKAEAKAKVRGQRRLLPTANTKRGAMLCSFRKQGGRKKKGALQGGKRELVDGDGFKV